MEKGTFRRDLYYRLNVVKIRLAPLRDREEDIPVLMDHFLARLGAKRSFTAEAMETLLTYEWPGNVRELENCMQQMVAISAGPLLHVSDLPSSLQNFRLHSRSQFVAVAVAAATAGPSQALAMAQPAVLPLAEVERCAIKGALDRTNGDRAVAARLLGIGRTTLYRKLREYQIDVVSAA